MKKWVVLLLFCLLGCSCLLGQEEPKEFTVILHLSEDYRGKDRWMYLIESLWNGYRFLDSCKVNATDTLALLKGRASEVLDCEFYSPTDGVSFTQFVITPGKEIHLTYNKKMDPRKLPISPAHDERMHVFLDSWAIMDNVDAFKEKLYQTINYDSPEAVALRDSVKNYNDFATFHLTKLFDQAKYSKTIQTILLLIKSRVSDSTYNEMLLNAQMRFPQSQIIQDMYNYTFHRVPYPQAPIGSEAISKRREEWMQSKKKKEEVKEIEKTLYRATITAYVKGDSLTDTFVLKHFKSDTISYADISTPYILLDFWASWCAPCRKETPYLIDLQKKYTDQVTIFAVSIDDNEKAWREAILVDGSHHFKHIRINRKSPDGDYLLRKMGVSGIPANFLIDSKGKIIATHLRGDALEEKMKELVEKE